MSIEARISHFLGIDFGKAKVGLALADSETKMAFAHSTLENNSHLLDGILKIIEKNDVQVVVVGRPKHALGNKLGKEIGELVDSMERKAKIKIVFVDEMFTTKMAQDNLIEAGKKNLNKIDDKEAARIILQEYLDGQTS